MATAGSSLYAHLSGINVVLRPECGPGHHHLALLAAPVIRAVRHLHFELMHTLYSKVNPWNFLAATLKGGIHRFLKILKICVKSA